MLQIRTGGPATPIAPTGNVDPPETVRKPYSGGDGPGAARRARSENSSACSAVTSRQHDLHSNVSLSARLFATRANRIKPLQLGQITRRSVVTQTLSIAFMAFLAEEVPTFRLGLRQLRKVRSKSAVPPRQRHLILIASCRRLPCASSNVAGLSYSTNLFLGKLGCRCLSRRTHTAPSQ